MRKLTLSIALCIGLFASGPLLAKKRPIVFVHGFAGCDVLNFPSLIRRFNKAGWRKSWLYSYTYNSFSGVRSAAYVLKRKVADCRARTGRSKVDIVAHSMGGLVARYYLKYLGGSDYVKRLVTFGTPHKGTIWAYGCWFSSCYDMRPYSSMIRKLGTSKCQRSLWSSCDEIIIPNSSAKCGNSVYIGCWGHLLQLSSYRAFKKARNYLD